MELKAIPLNYTYDFLHLPITEYKYFSFADILPFDPGAEECSLVNALWLGEMSMLAYVKDRAFVEERLAEAGFPLVYFFDQPGSQGFICKRDDLVIVTYRGSEPDDMQDVLFDLDVWLVPSGFGEGKMHRGFKEAVEETWDEVVTWLMMNSSRRKVWFTGHSLGAAMATYAAGLYERTQGAMVFGCPCLLDEESVRHFPARVFSFEYNTDLVPLILRPLLDVAGEVKYIDENGKIHDNPSLKERLWHGWEGEKAFLLKLWESRGDKDIKCQLPKSWVDHAILHYVIHIWNKVVENQL